MRPFARLLIAAAVATAAGAATAQQIVNIQGFGADGAGAFISSYPVAPGTPVSLFNPVLLDLPAGTYALSDAWGLPGALYDAWNFNTGVPGSWTSHFVVARLTEAGGYVTVLNGLAPLDPTCKNRPYCSWDTREQASTAFQSAAPFVITLPAASRLAFVSADHYLPDNAGGISLLISPVPELPSAWLTLAGGLALAGWLRRRAPRPRGAMPPG